MIPYELHITEADVTRSCAPSPDYDPIDHHGHNDACGCGHPVLPIEPTLHEAIVDAQAGIGRLLEYDISERLRERLIVAQTQLEEEVTG